MSATGYIIGTFPWDTTPQFIRYHTDYISKPILQQHDNDDDDDSNNTINNIIINNEDEEEKEEGSIESMVNDVCRALIQEKEFYSDKLNTIKLSVSGSIIPSQLSSKRYGILKHTAMRMLLLRYINYTNNPTITIGFIPSTSNNDDTIHNGQQQHSSSKCCYVDEGGALLTYRLSNIELLSLSIKAGNKLSGIVNNVSGNNINVTILNTWAARIPSNNMLSDWTYDEDNTLWRRLTTTTTNNNTIIEKGTHVTFFIDNVITGSNSDNEDYVDDADNGVDDCYGVGGVDENDVDAIFTKKWVAANNNNQEPPTTNSSSKPYNCLITNKKDESTSIVSADNTFIIIGALVEPTNTTKDDNEKMKNNKKRHHKQDDDEQQEKQQKHHHSKKHRKD